LKQSGHLYYSVVLEEESKPFAFTADRAHGYSSFALRPQARGGSPIAAEATGTSDSLPEAGSV